MYDKDKGLYIAHCAGGPLSILGKMANRHGLIAGATGTGKTVTLQVIAESFCQVGVPCFHAAGNICIRFFSLLYQNRRGRRFFAAGKEQHISRYADGHDAEPHHDVKALVLQKCHQPLLQRTFLHFMHLRQ